MKHIVFTKPYWGKEEITAARDAIQTTLGTGDGPHTARFISSMQKILDVPYVLPVTSCTHGLEMILACMGLKRGDEVIVPSFTMSSTANAIILAGATPVFCDIEDRRYTIDPKDIQRRITPHTKGIMLVHYAGMPCLMEEILDIAKKHHLFIVEDAAHTMGALYKGRALGTWGDAGAYSFHGTKNVCCGEGGAVVTRDTKLADAMEVYRANGTNRREFLRGTVDKYTWVGKGTSFFLSDILCAMLVMQLKKIPRINSMRSSIAKAYSKHLKPYQNLIILPSVPAGCVPNWHIYGIRFKKESHAKVLYDHMRAHGIDVTTHYVPLHSSPMGRILNGGKKHPLPVTDIVAKTLIRLPIYPGLTREELHHIIQEAQSVLKQL